MGNSIECPRLVIVGAGFAGIGLAIRLKAQGIEDFVILEKAVSIGGVWRENTYPGAACDIPSHLYSFSFFPRPDWSRKFAPQAEILDYMHRCVDHFELRQHIRLNTAVKEARYQEDIGQWQIEAVELCDGKPRTIQLRTQFLVTACGQLSRPALPNIPGRDNFEGLQFHSAQWNHCAGLQGKNVAVIGTGASAIQFVPEIARVVRKLTLFQRSAPYVIHKPDRAYSFWEQRLLAWFPGLLRLNRMATYVIFESRFLGFKGPSRLMELMKGQWRKRMYSIIGDRLLRQQLTPDYPFGSKRILLSNDFYPTFNRPNVQLETQGIDHISNDTIMTKDGRSHRVDAIIYGTGFKTTEFITPMKVFGRQGKELNQSWQDGAEAYLGMSVNGYPNFFMLYGPNTNLGHNSIIFMLESQFNYLLSAINTLDQRGMNTLEVKSRVQSEFNARIQELAQATIWNSDCHSWYKTESGKITNNWPDFTWRYWQLTRRINPADFVMNRQQPVLKEPARDTSAEAMA